MKKLFAPSFVEIGTVTGNKIRIENGTESRSESKAERGPKLRTGLMWKTSGETGSESSVTGGGIESGNGLGLTSIDAEDEEIYSLSILAEL
ncbi:hypothetical protein EVAR_51822_1 [Eumeta japonica]|uniref:Uncharacterized protein n=1 Tax=Eumeta variegata TaxID=151549 RepID=A0A4C1XYJ4_EUMVA|nr:hypothetical protein EVAR_51822_1 [Eumeta japonica]